MWSPWSPESRPDTRLPYWGVDMAVDIVSNRILRALLLGLGTMSVILGVIGIVIPLLPTTPFLLLAAWCYARSSRRFYRWLVSNRLFGEYIKDYHEGRGISRSVKALVLATLWTTIVLSAYLFMEQLWIRIVLLVIAITVSWHILSIKTLARASISD